MSVKLVFQERPNMGTVYWRVFTKRGNKLRAGEALPETTADWKGSPVEASRLSAYCDVCGFAGAGECCSAHGCRPSAPAETRGPTASRNAAARP